MAKYRLSDLTIEDLNGIAQYTERMWGLTQAYRYVNALKEAFARIALNPNVGRKCNDILQEYRRVEQGRHVIFYRLDDTQCSSQESCIKACCQEGTFSRIEAKNGGGLAVLHDRLRRGIEG